MTHPLSSQNRPVLALHGSASSGKQWRALAKSLQDERTVITPDLPGYGREPIGAYKKMHDRFNFPIQDLLARHDQIDLVGHSWGGAVAMYLAECFPARIANVVLYEPIVPPSPVDGDYTAGLAPLRNLWLRTRDLTQREAMHAFSDFWSGKGVWETLPEAAKDRLINDYDALMLDFEQVFEGRVRKAVQTYCGPLAVLRGTKSPAVVQHMTDHLVSLYPQATLTVLPGLAHLAPAMQPGEVNPHICQPLRASFIEAAPSRSAA